MDSPFGKTLLPQMPPEFQTGVYKQTTKPWALIVVLVVILLFSFFWFYEYKRTDVINPTPTTQTSALHTQSTTPQSEVTQTSPLDDIVTLQSAVINTSVPNYSILF